MGKHETKSEGGSSFISKQFEQKFSLPSGVKPESITSSLSRDCVLTVTAPREITGFRKSRGALQQVCHKFGLSQVWFCHKFGLSQVWFVSSLVCHKFGLSTFNYCQVLAFFLFTF